MAVWHCPEHAQSGPEPLLQVRARSLGVTGNVLPLGLPVTEKEAVWERLNSLLPF